MSYKKDSILPVTQRYNPKKKQDDSSKNKTGHTPTTSLQSKQMLILCVFGLVITGITAYQLYTLQQHILPEQSDKPIRHNETNALVFFQGTSPRRTTSMVSTSTSSPYAAHSNYRSTYFRKRSAPPSTPQKMPYEQFYVQFVRDKIGLQINSTKCYEWFNTSSRKSSHRSRLAALEARFTKDGFVKRVVASTFYFDIDETTLNSCKELQDLQILSSCLHRTWLWLLNVKANSLFMLGAEDILAMKELYLSLRENSLPTGIQAFNFNAKQYSSLIDVFITACNKTLSNTHNLLPASKLTNDLLTEFILNIKLAHNNIEKELRLFPREEYISSALAII